MSLLSSFVASHLIPALESAFIAHEPEMQAAFLSEVKALSDQVNVWLENKLEPKKGS
jgi:hypothetical protein